MNNITYKVGIIGGAGYTAGELIRIALNHPNISLHWIQSKSQSGKPVNSVHRDITSEQNLMFTDGIDPTGTDLIFLCGGHGQSKKLLTEKPELLETPIIDLSQDFRSEEDYNFIYGLPEIQKNKITSSRRIANPGCFATAIQLALAPLAKKGLMKSPAHITAITGSTGAGFNPSVTTHFSWREGNVSTYKVYEHQHLSEIKHGLSKLDSTNDHEILFVPIRGNFTRGILASIQLKLMTGFDQADLKQIYCDFYTNHPFTHVMEGDVDLKQVVNTNNCFISINAKGSYLHVTSIIDNLIKGASGQAIQNFNLMMNLPENSGLNLKASAF